MQDSIDEFYLDVISPFVREFEECRSDIRRAYGAVWALDSYASHIFYFYKGLRSLSDAGDIEFKRDTLGPKSPDFKLIMDVAAATKHAVRSNPNKSKSSVYASSDIISVNLIGWSAYFAQIEANKWGDQVIIHNDRHLFAPLLPIVLRAEVFLTSVKDGLENRS